VADVKQAKPDASGRWVAQVAGRSLPLTIAPSLQSAVQAMLDRTQVPYGAVVLLDPGTGDVLAMAEHRQAGDPTGAIGGLDQPATPAASVFKVVTAAALLEAGQGAQSTACSHGGRHGIDASHLRARAGDRHCETLTQAIARSSNAIFARQALDHLSAAALGQTASRFGFNASVPGDLEVVPSKFEAGRTPLDLARVAPGFQGSTLSPLHGALLAAAVANHGQAMQLRLTSEHPPVAGAQVLPPAQADELAAMMAHTVTEGTGRKAFGARPKSLRGVEVAGKTGSLSGTDPAVFRHFSWFVGFAPVERPRFAVAALAINGPQWKVKGAALARDALALAFEQAPAPSTVAPPVVGLVAP
jgi:cell division protein FtsI/penicillin-binding protein 2